MIFPRRVAVLCAALLALGACSGNSVKDTLGLTRSAPDEFRVVPRPALTVPPQFSLRPPAGVGDDTASAMPASKQAESIVLGNGGKGSAKGDTFTIQNSGDTSVAPVSSSNLEKQGRSRATGGSNAEAQFLSNAGADKADPKVRADIEADKNPGAPVAEEDDSSWWDIFGSTPAKKDPMVNPGKEAQRIKTNKDEGKPVTNGDTPETQGRDRGVLGRILGD